MTRLQALAVLLAAGLTSTPLFAHFPIPPKKGELGQKAVQAQVPNFTLVDQDGKIFRFTNAKGRWVLVTFVFTTCPDLCPLVTAKFASIQRALQEKKRGDYLLLTITTDPERDTPAVLKKYAQQYKADLSHWLFLTGSRAELERVWSRFGVNVKKTSDGQIQHTALTTLINRQGIRQLDYYSDKWQEKEILKALSALEASNPK